MKKILCSLFTAVIVFSSAPAFSCVMWGQHTCIQDCKDMPAWLYPICIYGGTYTH